MHDFVRLDFETASTEDLKKSGVHRYAAHPNTSVRLLSYAFPGEAPKRWREGQPFPVDLAEHVANGGQVRAFNAAFERVLWNVALRRQFPHLAVMMLEQCHCSMAKAYAMALPGDLDRTAIVLKTPHQKDKEGHAVMLRYCRPRRVEADGTIVWWSYEEKGARVADYCDVDVITEGEVDDRVLDLSPAEQRLWQLDQVINARGVQLDVPRIELALDCVDETKKQINTEMKELTGATASQVKQLTEYIQEQGYDIDGLRKDTMPDLLKEAKEHGDHKIIRLVELRQQFSKTSTSKYKAMMSCVGADGRARDVVQYHVASTGRWGGRLFQPHNMPRVDEETQLPWVMFLHRLLDEYGHDPKLAVKMISAHLGHPMVWLSLMIRSVVIAAEGCDLIGADLSNIEGRYNGWQAGAAWKLDAFRRYDDGTGKDLYNLAFANAFGKDVDAVTKPERNIGKVQELAQGYQGSVGAWISMAANYGITAEKLTEVAQLVYGITSSVVWNSTAEAYAKRPQFGLDEFTWTGIKVVVDSWRRGNPEIVQSWWDLQDAAIEAVSSPGSVVDTCNGRVRYMYDHGVLWAMLPSDRLLAYNNPQLKKETSDFSDRKQWKVKFEGLNDKNQWVVKSLYGGLQCENTVQAGARDALVEKMWMLEYANYPIVLHVHDEAVVEVKEGEGSVAECEAIMTKPVSFLPGMPVNANVWRDKRYIK